VSNRFKKSKERFPSVRSFKLSRQHLRVLKMNTEQPIDPKAGYSRSELRNVENAIHLADEALGEYEVRINAIIDEAQVDARLVRLAGGAPDAIQLEVSRINDQANMDVEEIDQELGNDMVEMVLEDDKFDWWSKNWKQRDNFMGSRAARQAVFAIDDAFEHAETLKVETDGDEKRLVPMDDHAKSNGRAGIGGKTKLLSRVK
jgi:hypothetical protein